MNFEQIVPFILLLIIWGAGRILNRMGTSNQKKQVSAERKPVLVKILQQLATLKEKGSNGEFNEYSPPPSPPPVMEEKKSLVDTTKDSLPQEPTVTDRKKVSVLPPIEVEPRDTGLYKKPLETMDRHKLQNAVIWAEILAPPVALRD